MISSISYASQIWHPCSQMKDYEQFKPLRVTQAKGSYIYLENGTKLLDAISSWWCKPLGHHHPKLKAALLEQVNQFEHVLLANTTYNKIEKLSEVLCDLMPHTNKVFYAGDGSSAVEIALKMSIHYHQAISNQQRTKFLTLSNAYHGETTGALSISDVGIYRNIYKPLLFDPIIISPPYVHSTADPQWHDADAYWKKIEKQLNPHKNDIAAIVIEPILQAAAGMKLYSKNFLEKLSTYANNHGIHIIADEIMTGLGRTGKMLACQHTSIQPDFICLGKSLSAGWLPMSAVLTTDHIYEAFYHDYHLGNSFLHSHTYSGNALGVSIALETLTQIKNQKLCHRATMLHDIMRQMMLDIASKTGLLTNIRGIGAMVAADLNTTRMPTRAGYQVYQHAVKLGALLRPIGNTIYWLPPLNIDLDDLHRLKVITEESVMQTYKSWIFAAHP